MVQMKLIEMRKAKTTLLSLFIILSCSAVLLLPHGAKAVSLKQHSIVQDGVITLGDVFSDLRSGHDRVLGAAPRPGKDITLNARTLMRVAIALDLPWRPNTNADQVRITRAATLIDTKTIKNVVRTALLDKGLSQNLDVTFLDGSTELILPEGMDSSVDVVSLDIQPSSGHFTVEIVAPSRDNPHTRKTLTGRFDYIVQIPVLKETMRHNTVIGLRDIDYIEMRERDLHSDVILDADTLIGMTPRRIARTGEPLKTQDIESPRLVTRGDMVTMIFEANGLRLTAQGKALEHGSKGDLVRVANTQSSKNIQGLVTGNKEIIIKAY